MRLKNYALFYTICQLGLPEVLFNAVKSLMVFGEMLKDCEQSILFLKKCKKFRIFPAFILNNFKHHDSAFPNKPSIYTLQLVFKLRFQLLNQNISFKCNKIKQLKEDIDTVKSHLRSVLHSELYDHVLFLFDDS